ncbi:MAG: gamma-glutamyl-gamma-aminobutyrate hydrolase family protein [Bacteroidales bacterium]|nr:gamma-glutamyl-gamma-aminobutyrate hydrolase family protein [Bacteroidales bacterium]
MTKRFATLFIAVLLSAVVPANGKVTGKPVVGISPSMIQGRFGTTDGYTTAICKAGGIPVILPLVTNEKDAETVIARVDALLMTGGEDVNPALYGEEVLNSTVGVNRLRDTMDICLIRAAIKKHKPIMAICRGEQILNVALGGTLYQDIPTQIPGSQHRQPDYIGEPYHMVGLEPGSILRELFGCDSLMVNSAHHQAVKDIATGLHVTARSAEGIVEAYEGKGIIAMQFHPEALVYNGHNEYLCIFEHFLSKCRKQ